MNRICPDEYLLSEYVSGCLSPVDKADVERHAANCHACRQLIAETHEILAKPDHYGTRLRLAAWARKNKWLLAAALCLAASFTIHHYFFQLLAASLITGIKWILDAGPARTLIMVHEARERGGRTRRHINAP